MSQELTVIEISNPLVVFSTPKGLDAVIDKIEAEAKSVVRDISTQAGRDNIRSLAHDLAKAKNMLDKMGKDLTEEQRAQITAVNAERSRAWDRMEALQAEIREPLTTWENADKVRVKAHEDGLVIIQNHTVFLAPPSPTDVERSIASLIEYGKSRNWDEFAGRAQMEHEKAYKYLTEKLAEVKKNEADALELARLKAEEAARLQAEREAKIAADAAAKAKADAEAVAALAAKKAADEAAAAAAREENERIEKVAAQQRAEKAEADRAAAAKQAEIDKQQAAEAAKAAADKAALDAVLAAALAETEKQKAVEAAAQAERDRNAAEIDKQIKAQKEREADKTHKAKINNEAAAALVLKIETHAAGDVEGLVKKILTAIVKGEIPHVSITY